MTQGGKPHRQTEIAGEVSAFAPLTPLLKPEEYDLDEAAKRFSRALSKFHSEVSLQIEILDGRDTHSFEVESGAGRSAAHRRHAADPHVRVVLRRETWLRIMQGTLNPFDAFASGKLRVAGDTELAKKLVEQLSDPRVPYVSPC